MEFFDILCPGGREGQIIDYIMAYAKNLGYECKCDVFGNLICNKGNSQKLAFECGVDNISIMKTAETENGMIKVAVPNASAVRNLIGKKIQFLNGVVGVVRSNKKEEVVDFDLEVDIGVCNKEDAKKVVPTGEFASLICDNFESDDFMFGNGLSSYIPVMIFLNMMKKVQSATFLFTVQKRFGGRGLKALLSNYEAETIISLNVLPEKDNIKCGKGAVVVVKEKGTVPSVKIRQELISVSGENIQIGSTDENLYLDLPVICGNGSLVGGVCIPVRDKDGAYEAISKKDISSAEKLLINYINKVM